jgi:hypothetical protein
VSGFPSKYYFDGAQQRGGREAPASSERTRRKPAGEAHGPKPSELVRRQGAALPRPFLSRPTPAMRAAAVGDYSNGIATELLWDAWTFIKADLTVSLAREPVGEWILSDAECWVGEDGTPMAMCRLVDERGTFGRAVQSLLVERR